MIPAGLWVGSQLWAEFFGSADAVAKASAKNARTATERHKVAQNVKRRRGERLGSFCLIANVVMLAICALAFWQMYEAVQRDGMISTWDPYEILGVQSGDTNRQIKRAYRKLSLQYHPDKNPGDRSAEEKFMNIAKAYEALTDEAAKENWEKYGNPDGRQSMEVSIGLPKWLEDAGNQNIVLILYFVFLVLVIPAAVGLYYNYSSKYSDSYVMVETYHFYNYMLKPNMVPPKLVLTLAMSTEFKELPTSELTGAAKRKALGKEGKGGKSFSKVRTIMKQDSVLPKLTPTERKYVEAFPTLERSSELLFAYLSRTGTQELWEDPEKDALLSLLANGGEAPVERQILQANGKPAPGPAAKVQLPGKEDKTLLSVGMGLPEDAPHLSKNDMRDLNAILKKAPLLLEAMLEVPLAPQNNWLQLSMYLLDVSQCVIQVSFCISNLSLSFPRVLSLSLSPPPLSLPLTLTPLTINSPGAVASGLVAATAAPLFQPIRRQARPRHVHLEHAAQEQARTPAPQGQQLYGHGRPFRAEEESALRRGPLHADAMRRHRGRVPWDAPLRHRRGVGSRR